MAKDIAPRNQEVAPTSNNNMNWAEEYGSEGFQSTIVGTLLKFNKGEWLAGQEEEEITIGTKLIAAAHLLQSGWIRWEDNKPAEIVMGLRADGFRPPARETLGYSDKALWGELNGQQIDPWRRTDLLLLADPETGDIYTYSPMSEGGLGAIKDLMKVYGANLRRAPNDIPLVELGATSYKHAQFGKIYKPVLTAVEWRDANDVSFTPIDEDEEEPKTATVTPMRRASAQKPAPLANKKNSSRR